MGAAICPDKKCDDQTSSTHNIKIISKPVPKPNQKESVQQGQAVRLSECDGSEIERRNDQTNTPRKAISEIESEEKMSAGRKTLSNIQEVTEYSDTNLGGN